MAKETRPEWMTSISSMVNPEDYLMGRKIDKTFELSQQEKLQRARELRASLLASDKIRLADDPLLELERRKQKLEEEIFSNPVWLKQLREQILREDREKELALKGYSRSHEVVEPSSSKQESRSSRGDIRHHKPHEKSHRSSSSSSSRSRSRSHSRTRRRHHKHERQRISRSPKSNSRRYHSSERKNVDRQSPDRRRPRHRHSPERGHTDSRSRYKQSERRSRSRDREQRHRR